MMTVKIVFTKVALLISHKVEKASLFSEDQSKRVRKILSLPFLNENQHEIFFQRWLWKLFV